MKRFAILALAVVMLCVLLAACSGTGYLEDGYSNVSTTRDGRVNGSNGEYGFSGSSYRNGVSSYSNGVRGTHGTNGTGTYGADRSSGTGMVGGE